ncbi:MAG: ornithine cyclodeaminase family protein [Chloroflexi bacterium]|nr:ornithine cyclodeaminase family protein [Chloroflexota bacterium]
MTTLLINRKAAVGLLDMSEIMDAVEQAFRDDAEGRSIMPAKTYVQLERGDFRAMPAALPGAAGIKWVNVHPNNRRYGLPTVMAVFIYSDPGNGYPLAIMDATDLTAYRTAASSACATKFLARRNARTLGLIGAGRQAQMHLISHALLLPLEKVKVYDVRPAAVDAFIAQFQQYNVVPASIEEAADSDIVCTLTPATKPVVLSQWIKPGTHINAVGADAPGKEELDPSILTKARVIVDGLDQASHGGEINVPISRGLYSREQIWATLGQVITGKKPGRENDQQITIFDSTGLAIEDLAAARVVYRKAERLGTYPQIDMINSISPEGIEPVSSLGALGK